MRKLFRQQELMHFNSGHIFTNRAGKIHNATQIKHTKNITSLRKAKLYHPRFLVVWKWWAGDFSPLRVFFFLRDLGFYISCVHQNMEISSWKTRSHAGRWLSISGVLRQTATFSAQSLGQQNRKMEFRTRTQGPPIFSSCLCIENN